MGLPYSEIERIQELDGNSLTEKLCKELGIDRSPDWNPHSDWNDAFEAFKLANLQENSMYIVLEMEPAETRIINIKECPHCYDHKRWIMGHSFDMGPASLCIAIIFALKNKENKIGSENL